MFFPLQIIPPFLLNHLPFYDKFFYLLILSRGDFISSFSLLPFFLPLFPSSASSFPSSSPYPLYLPSIYKPGVLIYLNVYFSSLTSSLLLHIFFEHHSSIWKRYLNALSIKSLLYRFSYFRTGSPRRGSVRHPEQCS